jgi:hypothetical protein
MEHLQMKQNPSYVKFVRLDIDVLIPGKLQTNVVKDIIVLVE